MFNWIRGENNNNPDFQDVSDFYSMAHISKSVKYND